MLLCLHQSIKFREDYDHDMHCQGWMCLQCGHLAVGECHHQSWCREDFCGADPVEATESAPLNPVLT